MTDKNKKFVGAIFAVTIFLISALLTGCGENKKVAAPMKFQVKAIEVLHQSTPVIYGFP